MKVDMAYLLRRGINITFVEEKNGESRVYVEFTHDNSKTEGKARCYVNIEHPLSEETGEPYPPEESDFLEAVLDAVDEIRYNMNPKRRLKDAQPNILL